MFGNGIGWCFIKYNYSSLLGQAINHIYQGIEEDNFMNYTRNDETYWLLKSFLAPKVLKWTCASIKYGFQTVCHYGKVEFLLYKKGPINFFYYPFVNNVNVTISLTC